jgi:hypothetical protein
MIEFCRERFGNDWCDRSYPPGLEFVLGRERFGIPFGPRPFTAAVLASSAAVAAVGTAVNEPERTWLPFPRFRALFSRLGPVTAGGRGAGMVRERSMPEFRGRDIRWPFCCCGS